MTTSLVARRTGLAGLLTAETLSRQAAAGAAVSALGIFDQGFYDRFGYGTGPYERWIDFDPANLRVPKDCRPPRRLTIDDHEAMHRACMGRLRGHGAVNLTSLPAFETELLWTEKPFGLGYFDGPGGELTHFIWGEMKDEYGPFNITWRAYQDHGQLMELLSLIRSLSDQVNMVGTLEFGEVQLQDLIDRPFRNRRASVKGRFEQGVRAMAYWQARILDLPACIRACHFDRGVRFNLELTDPAPAHLPEGNNWSGVSGAYTVDLGPESSVSNGTSASLPTLKASVNTFSRLWLGARPASSLAITDDFEAEPRLIRDLDSVITLPPPHLGWDF